MVTDNSGGTGFDDMTLTVSGLGTNTPPVAAQWGPIGTSNNSVELYDNGSSDADGTIVAYAWTRISGPNTPTITNANTNHATLSGLINGTYSYRETVTDNGGLTAVHDNTITVSGLSGGSNTAPTANAGSNQTIGISTATVSGSGTDSDGTIVAYSWSKQSGGSATLTNASTSTLSLSGLVAGSYTFRLTVTDNGGLTGFDDMVITVTGGGSGSSTSQFVDFDFVSAIGPGGVVVPTLVYLPVGYGSGQKFPVIIQLGGVGEKTDNAKTRSQNIAHQKTVDVGGWVGSGHDIPFVVLIPMISFAEFDSYDGGTFQNGLFTNEMRQWAIDHYDGDPQRCHIRGLSLGGQTICNSAIAYPNNWATCTINNSFAQAYTLAGGVRAVFNIHTTQNDIYLYGNPPYGIVAWIDELNNLGRVGFPSTYTIYTNYGHSGWNEDANLTAGSRTLMTGSSVPNNTPWYNPYTWMLQYKIVGGVVSLY
jgi:hypothetical protein